MSIHNTNGQKTLAFPIVFRPFFIKRIDYFEHMCYYVLGVILKRRRLVRRPFLKGGGPLAKVFYKGVLSWNI